MDGDLFAIKHIPVIMNALFVLFLSQTQARSKGFRHRKQDTSQSILAGAVSWLWLVHLFVPPCIRQQNETPRVCFTYWLIHCGGLWERSHLWSPWQAPRRKESQRKVLSLCFTLSPTDFFLEASGNWDILIFYGPIVFLWNSCNSVVLQTLPPTFRLKKLLWNFCSQSGHL